MRPIIHICLFILLCVLVKLLIQETIKEYDIGVWLYCRHHLDDNSEQCIRQFHPRIRDD